MRPVIFIIATLFFSSCDHFSSKKSLSSAEKLSLQLGNATLWFQQSAEMELSFLQAYDKGKMLLKMKMDTLTTSAFPPAVVLDLDETVLDNSPFEARLFLEGENYSSESWGKWCTEAKAEALPGAIDFLNFADSLGVKIFYISNRKINVFEPTLKNLKTLKLPQAEKDHLFLRTTKSDKSERREMVAARHNILLYVGDNLTDYSQKFAERDSTLGKNLVKKNYKEVLHNFIILPNPMYGEWESAIYENDFARTYEEKIEMRRKVIDAAN
ncbi:5'-nucleotidase, lipoprotein e(P4) family [Marivirga harenae]|uniref:5'-nucleotidase, lipoprotein e(P4) family n=1 Tax=Marivirga harenae TaxID=2010992 RepID=UPI0026E027DA|nr:5'-nucleotidase, lipoprotein e(P4) family [Marivirga harenae]WKV12538.1 5'-nucleotidase, lipoprotein e(P4) family [Marivirga harenae]|tara:strand:+ start:22935 stop:23741 length:807 start_codon:yes stop_codon:yes gene_type:complete